MFRRVVNGISRSHQVGPVVPHQLFTLSHYLNNQYNQINNFYLCIGECANNHCFNSPFNFGARFSIITETSCCKSNLCFHPQSPRASLSSIESGQESAICWRWSGLYVTSRGRCFLIASASCPTVKLMADKLQLVLTFIFSGSACIMARVALIASSIQIMGSSVYSFTKHSYWPEVRAPQKMPIAQSVVPPPGSSFQLIIPGYLRDLTSSPYLLKQYCPSSYPVYLVIPYMVEGSIEVC